MPENGQGQEKLTSIAVEAERLRTQMKAIQNELTVNKDIGNTLTNTKEHLIDSEKDRKSL